MKTILAWAALDDRYAAADTGLGGNSRPVPGGADDRHKRIAMERQRQDGILYEEVRVVRRLQIVVLLAVGVLGLQGRRAKADEQPGYISVRVPADAIVYINGSRTNQRSSVRKFEVPNLAFGQRYWYTIEAQVFRDGQWQVDRKRVAVFAGRMTPVTMDLHEQVNPFGGLEPSQASGMPQGNQAFFNGPGGGNSASSMSQPGMDGRSSGVRVAPFPNGPSGGTSSNSAQSSMNGRNSGQNFGGPSRTNAKQGNNAAPKNKQPPGRPNGPPP